MAIKKSSNMTRITYDDEGEHHEEKSENGYTKEEEDEEWVVVTDINGNVMGCKPRTLGHADCYPSAVIGFLQMTTDIGPRFILLHRKKGIKKMGGWLDTAGGMVTAREKGKTGESFSPEEPIDAMRKESQEEALGYLSLSEVNKLGIKEIGTGTAAEGFWCTIHAYVIEVPSSNGDWFLGLEERTFDGVTTMTADELTHMAGHLTDGCPTYPMKSDLRLILTRGMLLDYVNGSPVNGEDTIDAGQQVQQLKDRNEVEIGSGKSPTHIIHRITLATDENENSTAEAEKEALEKELKVTEKE